MKNFKSFDIIESKVIKFTGKVTRSPATDTVFPAHMSTSDIIRHTLKQHFGDDRHPSLITISASKTKEGTKIQFPISSSNVGHYSSSGWSEVYGNQTKFFNEFPHAIAPIAKDLKITPTPVPDSKLSDGTILKGDPGRHMVEFISNYTHEGRDFHTRLNAEFKKRGIPMAVHGDQDKIKYNKDGSKDIKVRPYPWNAEITSAHVTQVKAAIDSLHHSIIKDNSGWRGQGGIKPASEDPTHITDEVELRYKIKHKRAVLL